jgi:gas vesicle protein
MINFIFGLITGVLIGSVVSVGLMCILQIAKDDEE